MPHRRGSGDAHGRLQPVGKTRGAFGNGRAIAFPAFGDFFEDRSEARPAPFIGRREVRAGEDRLLVRRQKHRHGPAAVSLVHGDGGLHVDLIEIRTFLTIHLDAHVIAIHERGDLLVLERFPLHDVTPMTSGIPDRQEQGLILILGQPERFLTPGIPIHRVVGMLQQVGACFVNETVRRTGRVRISHGPDSSTGRKNGST